MFTSKLLRFSVWRGARYDPPMFTSGSTLPRLSVWRCAQKGPPRGRHWPDGALGGHSDNSLPGVNLEPTCLPEGWEVKTSNPPRYEPRETSQVASRQEVFRAMMSEKKCVVPKRSFFGCSDGARRPETRGASAAVRRKGMRAPSRGVGAPDAGFLPSDSGPRGAAVRLLCRRPAAVVGGSFFQLFFREAPIYGLCPWPHPRMHNSSRSGCRWPGLTSLP